MKTLAEINIDAGNNETLTKGLYQEADGTYSVITFTRSKNFKTLHKAKAFAAKCGIIKGNN